MSTDLAKDTEKEIQELSDRMKANPMLKVQSTKPIKLKDKVGRGGIKFNLLRDFGFIPEEIVIQKVSGRNNTFVISAVVPESVLQKENDKTKKKQDLGVDTGKKEAHS